MVFGGLNSHSGASVTGRFVSCESKKASRSEGKKSILREGREKGLAERHLFKAFTHISLIASAGDVRHRKEGINRMNLSLSVSTSSIFLLYHSTVISINFPTNVSKTFHLLFTVSVTSLFFLTRSMPLFLVQKLRASQKDIIFNHK